MQIAKNSVVTMDYTLTNNDGQVLDSSSGRDPLIYIHGAGGIIPGVEKALEGKSSGDNVKVSVPPEQGYGPRDESLISAVPRTAFAQVPNLTAGMRFQANTPQGPRIVTVVGIQEDKVTIDANHPLAGQTLNFDLNVREVREATAEELNHGHVHGAGGHQH